MGVVSARIDEGINCVSMVELTLAARLPLKLKAQEKVIGEPIRFVVEDIINDALQKVRFDGFIFELTDVSGGIDDNGFFYYTIVMRPKLSNIGTDATCDS
jgi:hypothetical protein